MKKIICLTILYTFILGAFAQHPTCDGNRYKNYAFFAVDSAIGVQYGQNTTMNHVAKNLLMDIYQPIPDAAAKRPLIIFIHGGGFVGGSRKDMTNVSIIFAAKGFVTATIDYRLIDITPKDSLDAATGVIQAVSDAKAAVRYFVEDAATANLYKIDTNYIFISGTSAGGITAAHVAYLDTTDQIPPYMAAIISNNGGFKGNSSANTSHTVPIKGVLNYSGALLRKDWISAGEPPIYSFHDAGDTIVPCGYALSKAFPFPIYVDGSCVMQPQADLKGIYNKIFIYPGSGHGAYLLSSPTVDSVLQWSSNFLYDILCTNILAINEQQRMETIQLYPNPATSTIRVDVPFKPEQKERIQVFNSMGGLCKEVEAAESNQISIADLPAGLYFIRLQNHFIESQRFIKE